MRLLHKYFKYLLRFLVLGFGAVVCLIVQPVYAKTKCNTFYGYLNNWTPYYWIFPYGQHGFVHGYGTIRVTVISPNTADNYLFTGHANHLRGPHIREELRIKPIISLWAYIYIDVGQNLCSSAGGNITPHDISVNTNWRPKKVFSMSYSITKGSHHDNKPGKITITVSCIPGKCPVPTTLIHLAVGSNRVA